MYFWITTTKPSIKLKLSLLNTFNVIINRPVCFIVERARAPRHFLLGKGLPMKKLYISTGAFQGHQGKDHGGIQAIALVAAMKYQAWIHISFFFNQTQILKDTIFNVVPKTNKKSLCHQILKMFTELLIKFKYSCNYKQKGKSILKQLL